MSAFSIDPSSFTVVLRTDSPSQGDFLVYNIGRTEVYAEPTDFDGINARAPPLGTRVKPREIQVVLNDDKLIRAIGLKIYNKTDVRAIVYASKEFEFKDVAVPKNGTTPFDVEYDSILEKLVAVLVPRVGSSLSALIEAFWPEGKANVWSQIRDVVATLVDAKILESINEALSGDIRQLEEKIKVLAGKLEKGEDVATFYMNIANGLSSKFSFGSEQRGYKTINFYLLPLYSTLVLMEIYFYNVGIQQAAQIGLSSDNVMDVKNLAAELIRGPNGAIKYVHDMVKERVDHAYNIANPLALYDTMMHVRTYMAVTGLEYIPVWNNILVQHTDEVYNDVISYSGLYGRLTAALNREAVPEAVPPPLTPKLINGRRDQLSYVEVYTWTSPETGAPKIGGLKLAFEYGDAYWTGTFSGKASRVDFQGATLTKLRVSGNGALDHLTFYFSDGREIAFGTDDPSYAHVFQLERHHIVSMYLSSDKTILNGQGVSIAVSYQLDEERSSPNQGIGLNCVI